jgi:hypothetical protein
LQSGDVVNSQECVVIFAKADLRSVELLLDEAVAVEVIRRLEGKERRHPHDDGAEDFIADVEVVVGETALLAGQNAVSGILGRKLRHGDAEARSLLHALEDEVDAVGVLPQHFP